MKPIKFPRDEKAHHKIIEWWYWNGHLKGEDGRNYAFMDCLFKADSRRVKLPLLRSPFKDFYFSHSLLSDVSRQKFYSEIDYIDVPSRQSFRRPLLFAEYIGLEPDTLFKGFAVNLMKEKKVFTYRIKTKNFDLELKSLKKPFLAGGKGFLNLSGRQTYYYSLTRLEAKGEIFLKNKSVKVSGLAWMDHQWADSAYRHDRWTWFSVQLENKTELVVIEYGLDKKNYYAGLCHPDGRQEHFTEVRISPLDVFWKSPKTGAHYVLAWKIEIPEKKIVLRARPLIKKQEMLFGAINYWEGPLSVSGRIGKKKVSGRGFLELVGRPIKFGALRMMKNILAAEAKKRINKFLGKK